MNNPFFKKSPVIILLFFLLSACQQEKKASFFLLNPDKIQSVYNECVYSVPEANQTQSEKCAAVFKALPIFRSSLSEYLNNPNQFAMDIMRAEIELVGLKKSYELAKKTANQNEINRLKQKIDQKKFDIQSRFALIRLVTKNE
jgi:hypothetical protein